MEVCQFCSHNIKLYFRILLEACSHIFDNSVLKGVKYEMKVYGSTDIFEIKKMKGSYFSFGLVNNKHMFYRFKSHYLKLEKGG